MELKTLKDIEIRGTPRLMQGPPYMVNGDCPSEFKTVNSGKLKQEIIKWIKELKIFEDKWKNKDYTKDKNMQEIIGCLGAWGDTGDIIEILKHIHNITGEDLK